MQRTSAIFIPSRVEYSSHSRGGKLQNDASLEKYRAFISQSSEGMWRFETKPILINLPPEEQVKLILSNAYLAECNDATARMYGYEKGSELVGISLDKFFVIDDPKNIEYMTAFVQSNYRLTDVESVEKDKDGNIRHFLNSLIGIVEDGYLVRAWGTQRDVTKDVETRAQLRQLLEEQRVASHRLERLQKISSEIVKASTREEIAQIAIQEGVPAVGADAGFFAILNEDRSVLKMVQHIGYSEAVTQFFSMPATIDAPAAWSARTGEVIVIQPGEPLGDRFKAIQEHYAKFDHSMISYPLKMRGQTVGAFVITFFKSHYITEKTLGIVHTLTELCGLAFDRISAYEEQREARLAAEKAKDEAERANRLKSAFLANMSHEIRTPLGAMIGFADLLRDPKITQAERTQYTNILHRNGQQLGHIINDILDLSKIEVGHLNFDYGKVDPIQILNEVMALLSVKAKEKNVRLEFTAESSVPKDLVTDPVRLRQVVTNIVGNAVKFTNVGSVKVRVYGKLENLKQMVCLEVTDTGIGISSEGMEKLFSMFSQADDSLTRKFGGTGLGLALSRSLARALGGDVELIQSSPNAGSKFLITVESQVSKVDEKTISLTARRHGDAEQLKNINLKGRSVLVVEDSPDNQQLILRYLTHHGATVDLADNGASGVEKALAGDHDIILMDLQMPLMDGYTATLRLRQQGYTKPIIALTAHAMSDIRKRCLEVGCTDHLPKPINRLDLINVVARYSTHH